jgi:hypothetical protein
MATRQYELPPSSFDDDTRRGRAALSWFFVALFSFGLATTLFSHSALLGGLGTIIISPDILINDYVGIGGLGPAFLNSSLCVFVAIVLVRRANITVSGPVIAAIFTIAGFSLFGKNIANIWPGLLGAWLYARASHRPFGENILVALFGTALAPLASEVAFGLGIPVPWSIAVALAAGGLAGFLLAPVARHVLDFHQGYNLYNIGFAAGFIGTVIMSALKAFGVPLSGGFHWAELGPLQSLPYLALLFIAMIITGIITEPRWFEAYRRLLESPGRLVSDFVRYYGLGATLVNMGVMGLLASLIVVLIGGSWNGPVIGGILTITGFAAFGKHPRNAVPPMAGAAVMAILSRYGLGAPASQLAVLFASTLAPLAGEYGPAAGLAAGAVHLVLVQVVGGLHGGLNLYNNGFAGGLTAGLLLPVLEWLRQWRRHEV